MIIKELKVNLWVKMERKRRFIDFLLEIFLIKLLEAIFEMEKK